MSKKESPIKTIIVAVVLSLVCSIVVSFAAIKLKPQQELNKELDRKRNILIAAGLLEQGGTQGEIEELFKQVETHVVDLETGELVEPPKNFNQRKFAKDPETNKVLEGKADIAGIKKRSQLANVYLVRDGQQLDTVILPVHGYGLWSTMYGFLALEPDTTTVVGFKYYEQGETAGLGGEVENPTWRAFWPGKEVLNEQGEPVIKLVKGAAQNEHQVDGLSGATLTSNGVENTLHYWLGKDGFGPFLAKIRAGEI
ncbi:Na(+)-translocating NADH-quinone reductase subunit C [Kangiella shandongensis]|uniref:Na(+)-translocating NADH-quinone reductase subunit C n=1 Tax=Kangiella shandongensis TaxID=2763258 RepID=UPI001CBB05AD|nr:Na(+)-translocating NADH-quinone reductase subunit C [Kangiella shandongensis]